jgi:1-deoxy-D-xylulose-5-phosphate reductoisomerase
VRLAYRALERGGTLPAVLNAANEEAVAAFLDGRIPFPAIPETIAEVMDAHEAAPLASLGRVLEADAWARSFSRTVLDRHAAARAAS